MCATFMYEFATGPPAAKRNNMHPATRFVCLLVLIIPLLYLSYDFTIWRLDNK
jgi:hypothetical protein